MIPPLYLIELKHITNKIWLVFLTLDLLMINYQYKIPMDYFLMFPGCYWQRLANVTVA